MRKFRRPADIRVGVVGYGPACNMGKYHVDVLKRVGLTPVAVADIDESRLPIARQDHPGLKTFNSATEMLARTDVDLVVVVTPHRTHSPLATECLEAGRHVITEKPFMLTTAECDAAIALARRKKRVLSTHHNRHWDGWVTKAVELLVERRLVGDIVRVEAHMGGLHKPGETWRASRSISGGILYDWGVHLVEYALQILNSGILEVSGYSRQGYWASQCPWGDDTIEDEATAVVRMAGDKTLTLRMSHIDPKPREGWLEVFGTEGYFQFDHEKWKARVRDGSGTAELEGRHLATEWWRFYENIAAHLIDGAPLIITPQYARRPIHILDLANRSAAAGHALEAVYR